MTTNQVNENKTNDILSLVIYFRGGKRKASKKTSKKTSKKGSKKF